MEEIAQASIGTKAIVQKMILEHKIAGVPMKTGWNLIVVGKDLKTYWLLSHYLFRYRRDLDIDSPFVIWTKHIILNSSEKRNGT